MYFAVFIVFFWFWNVLGTVCGGPKILENLCFFPRRATGSSSSPLHPSTPAPPHPSTPASQHPSTPAPQHPSTPAPNTPPP